MTKFILLLAVSSMLISCASQPKPLPEGGPTTKQILMGEREDISATSSYSSNHSFNITTPVSMSSQTTQKLRELNHDFKRVPNPQILGYVAPHFNQANMPVPGYFTVFRLYKKDSYALQSEDAAAGVSQ